MVSAAVASSTIVTSGEQTRRPSRPTRKLRPSSYALAPNPSQPSHWTRDRGRVGLQHHRVGAGGELARLAAVHRLAGGPLAEGGDVQVGQGRLGPLGPAGARPGVGQDREAGRGGRPGGPDPAGVGQGDLQLAGLAGPGGGDPGRQPADHPGDQPGPGRRVGGGGGLVVAAGPGVGGRAGHARVAGVGRHRPGHLGGPAGRGPHRRRVGGVHGGRPDPVAVDHHPDPDPEVLAPGRLVDAAGGEPGQPAGLPVDQRLDVVGAPGPEGGLGHLQQPLGPERRHRSTPPTWTLWNRAGAAPWPTRAFWKGWPLPQLGTPHTTQASGPQTASSEPQNSVVRPS